MALSVKEKGFFKGSKMRMVKDAIYMDFWRLIRLPEISTLHLGKASNSQMFMYTMCWLSKRTASM